MSSADRFDILCFSSSDWHGKWGSRQQVMMRFAARGYRVVFVERFAGLEHFCRYPDLRQQRRQRYREGMREASPNLWIWAPPVLVPGRYYSTTVARLNATIVYHRLVPILQRLGL